MVFLLFFKRYVASVCLQSAAYVWSTRIAFSSIIIIIIIFIWWAGGTNKSGSGCFSVVLTKNCLMSTFGVVLTQTSIRGSYSDFQCEFLLYLYQLFFLCSTSHSQFQVSHFLTRKRYTCVTCTMNMASYPYTFL